MPGAMSGFAVIIVEFVYLCPLCRPFHPCNSDNVVLLALNSDSVTFMNLDGEGSIPLPPGGLKATPQTSLSEDIQLAPVQIVNL